MPNCGDRSLVLVDSHIHLAEEVYRDDLDDLLQEAKRDNIACMVVPATDTASWDRVLDISKKHQELLPALGLQPHDAKEYTPELIDRLQALCPHLAAIGEIGLDFHYDLSPRPIQIDNFRAHLDLAKRSGLPVIMHCREAEDEFLRAIRDIGIHHGGVVHCCTCEWSYAEQFLELGLYIGVTGMVTFPKLKTVHTIAERCPLSRLLVETDGPYLAPVPFRGKRNRPAYVRYTAQAIAALRHAELTEVCQATTANAARLFGPAQCPSLNL
ncbi:TatD family hydrolase [bacterium]|nr:TatD family hydrolase [bacterium]